MSGLLKFLVSIFPTLVRWIKAWGASEERARQKERADALEKHYQDIAADRPSVDDALAKLRLRNVAKGDRDVS